MKEDGGQARRVGRELGKEHPVRVRGKHCSTKNNVEAVQTASELLEALGRWYRTRMG